LFFIKKHWFVLCVAFIADMDYNLGTKQTLSFLLHCAYGVFIVDKVSKHFSELQAAESVLKNVYFSSVLLRVFTCHCWIFDNLICYSFVWRGVGYYVCIAGILPVSDSCEDRSKVDFVSVIP